MNILDYPEQFTEKDVAKIWDFIFQKQEELARKYNEIENENDLRWSMKIPVGLNDKLGQAQLKDMAWRATEEVAESMEAFKAYTRSEDDGDLMHCKEELADGLHFLTELVILSDIDVKDIYNDVSLVPLQGNYNKEGLVFWFVYHLGNSMNLLKNKPWKKTQYETDILRYRVGIIKTYRAYIKLMLFFMNPLEILNYYFRKSQVNEFRIKSNY